MELLARIHRLELARARELLLRAEQAAAEDPQARSVREWFARLLEEEEDVRGAAGWHTAEAESGAAPARDPGRTSSPRGAAAYAPGRQTLVMHEATRAAWPARAAQEVYAPGRQTLVMREAAQEAHEEAARGEAAREPGLPTPASPAAPPAGASRPEAAPRREPGRLDVVTQWRMNQAFGFDFSGVSIRRDSPLATGATRALVKDGEVHFREGEYRPGTRAGDWLIAHELAHVVQQQAGRGDQPAPRKAIEREADRAATLALRGHAAPIALRAQPAVAYAYSDGEEHEPDAADAGGDLGAGDGGAEGGAHDEEAGAGADTAAADEAKEAASQVADQKADDTRKADAGANAGTAGEATPAEATPAEARGEPAREPASGETVEDPASGEAVEDPALDEGHEGGEGAADADDAEAGAVPAEEGEAAAGGAPGGGGSGGKPAEKEKVAPNVAAAKPEAGFTQLQGVRPDKLVPALGQMHAASTADVGKTRAEQKANPPKQLSTGDAAGPKKAGAAGAKGEAAKGEAAKGEAAGGAPAGGKGAAPGTDKADQPVKAEVPGGEAAKKAQQGAAAAQQKSAGQVVTEAAQSIASWFGSWFGGTAGKAGGDKQQAAMNEADQKQMAGSLDKLPTSASDISTQPGPAPELAMKGDAKARSDGERGKLETRTAQLEQQGRADSRVPMGEDEIETSVPAEELTAKAVPGGEAPEAALPTVEGAAPSEEVGIIAKEQHGAEIDAALAKAGADVTAERGKHAREEEKARADADTQLRDLKTKADADQAAAKAKAKAETEKARTEWQAEIDKKGADARKQADKKVAEGMAQVDAEEAKANAEAKQHIDEGKQKAEEEKQKGEKEAADAKAKGKSESSGFFGWLSSKAKAFFDGIKKAISAAIDAAKKAVKAVLDAAKKLAMAAIELARKAITAAIKAIGDALIAISDVLLAAFPELKAKFQGLVKRAVQAATDAVNKLAEGLKKAVQAALDLLGKAIDAALGLLEKGLHAIVDVAGAVVQGAIDAARAIADALGAWVKIIKDVASGPGAWIGKLGAAVVDGIKNHLWSAFKTAVVEWFKSKVFELLGVGGMILQVLLEGGITKDDIIQMALDALIVAIPAALIAILIEKLVAMIVPAAGAVMAIIEGLQAAWGTISRIIAAFGAFMAFLAAVQGGGAGPLFATALASAAIVLLDFVANWLLKKLRGAASRVGARLKGMAAKFKARGKGPKAKGAKKAPTKHADDHDGPGGKTKQDDDRPGTDKDRKKKEDKDKKNQEILARAQRELPPKIKKVLRGGIRGVLLKARLGVWKVQYRLTALEVTGGDNFQIRARVNPTAELIAGVSMDTDELLAFVRQVAEKMRNSDRVKKDAAAIKRSEREKRLSSPPGKGKPPRTAKVVDVPAGSTHMGVGEGLAQSGALPRGKVREINALTQDGKISATVRQQQPPFAPLTLEGAPRGSTQIVREPSASGSGFEPGEYLEIAKRLAPGLPPAARGPAIALALEEFARTGKAPAGFSETQLHALRVTLFGAEHSRSPAAGVFGQMSLDLMKSGMPPEEILGKTKDGGFHPLSPKGVSEERIALEERMKKVKDGEQVGEPSVAEARQMEREVKMIRAWLGTLKDLKFSATAEMAEKQQQIKDEIERRMMKSVS